MEGSCARLALVVRNGSDIVSFFQCELPLLPSHDPSDAVPDLVLRKLLEHRGLYDEKFAAVAFPRSLADQCPSLSLQLWKELDAIPYVVARKPHQRTQDDQGELATFAGWEEKQIDEKADSIARKCLRSAFCILQVIHAYSSSDQIQVLRHRPCAAHPPRSAWDGCSRHELQSTLGKRG